MIDLTDLIQHQQHLSLGRHTETCLMDLVCGLEQQRLHLPFGEAAVEIIKGAVPGAAAMAVAIGFAAFEQSLHEGGVQEMGREFKGAQQMSLALA